MTEAVTELVVRGDGALAVLDRYEDKMTDAGQATDRSTGAIDRYNAAMAKFAAAQQQGISISTQSVARRTAEERAMERWEATLSKTSRLEIQFRREAERAAVDMANAVALGYTTPQRAVAVLTELEQKHAMQLRDSAAAARQLDAALVGANDNRNLPIRAASSFNTANIAAQFQDIGVTAAMGMNPLQIALQQGTQLSAVFEQMKASGQSAASGLATAFASIISPVSLVTIGVIALVAAGLQMVDWSKSAAWAIDLFADNLETIAPYAAAAAAAIGLLYAPAILAGLTVLSETILTITARLVGLAVGFALANPAVAFVAGITVAVAAAAIFRDEITKILGVDIVSAAKTGANLVIGSFVAAYEDLKFVWNQFPNIIGAAAVGAANAAISAVSKMVNSAIDGINSLVAEIPSWLGGGGEGITFRMDEGDRWKNSFRAELEKAVGDRNKAVQDALSRDYLGEIGSGVGNMASAAADKLRELSTWMTTVDDKDKKSRRGKSDEEKAAERYDKLVRGAEQFVAAQELERQALFMTEEAAAALRYEQDLLNQAANANIKLTPEQTAQLRGLAQQMAAAEAETVRMADALDFAKDLAKGFASDFRSAFEQARSEGLSTWDSFWRGMADAALNALDKIVDKLMNDVIDAVFQVNSAAKGGGGGGILGFIGGLFGGGGGGFSGFEHAWTAAVPGLWAKGGAFSSSGVVPFAKGAAFTNSIVNRPTLFPFANGGVGMMGEAGPEAIMPLRRGPDGRLGVSANSNQAPNSSPVYAPVYQIDASGSEAGVEEKVRGVLRDHDRQSYQRFVRDFAEAKKRGVA